MSKKLLRSFLLMAIFLAGVAQGQDKPNILIIWGDDIGPFNISAYNMGVMGYKTPNIDRIANEGMIFTDSYGDQSCTAGRAGFITGQHPVRSVVRRAYVLDGAEYVQGRTIQGYIRRIPATPEAWQFRAVAKRLLW